MNQIANRITHRIKELRWVRAGDLKANPKNWRRHPLEQLEALRGMVLDVGFISAPITRILEDGSLELVDGHLRVAIAGDEEVLPVQVTDLSEEEAAKALATLDPIAGMAERDGGAYDELVEALTFQSVAAQELVNSLMEDMPIVSGQREGTETVLDQAIQLKPQREYIVVICDTDAEFDEIKERFSLQVVRRGGYKKGGKTPDEVGIERVIPARRVLDV